MKKLKIYIAGPYTAHTKDEVVANVKAAIDAGLELFARGHFPYVPHLTHYVDERANELGVALAWEDYIKWDLPWLEVCDALLYLRKSRGADLELEEAKKMGKQIFFTTKDVPRVSAESRDEEVQPSTLW